VARRGEVLVAKRRLGFGAEGKAERFVVLQSDRLRGLVSIVVAPTDADGPLYEDDPLVAHLSPHEVGAKQPHVVLAYMPSCVLLERFEAAPVGRLSRASMAEVDKVLKLALELA
jgi:hypothetical protein